MRIPRLLILATALFALALPSLSHAQQTYTQMQPSTCFLSDGYNCNGIPLTGGASYYFHAQHYTYFAPGDPVVIFTPGATYVGTITSVTQQPVFEFGVTSPFSFTFSANGITGSVSGTSEDERVGRWGIVIIESSTATIN